MFASLPNAVSNGAHLNYIRKVARSLGARVYSDVPYVKIKFYNHHNRAIPAMLLKALRELCPPKSYEVYAARVGGHEEIPAVRIRRDITTDTPIAEGGHAILTLIPENVNEDCIAEAAAIYPDNFDGKTPLYLMRDTNAGMYFMCADPFTLDEARGFPTE